MDAQVHEPHQGGLHGHSQRRRHLSRSRLILASVVLLLVVCITLVVLNILQLIQGLWYVLIPVVFTALGLIFASLQWLFPVDPSMSITTSYPDIVKQNPSIDSTTVERERAVEEVYARLSDYAISAFVLRGINGIGKTTLANLIYHFAEEKRSAGLGPFINEPIWIDLGPNFTFSDLAEVFSLVIKKPLPNLSGLSPRYQAEQMIKLLNSSKTRRIIILDFKNPVDSLEEGTLFNHPCFKEWLKALNSQSCTSRILFTGYPWSSNSNSYLPKYIEEYYVEGLNPAEGIELLQSCGVKGAVEELHSVVQMCDGHAGSLNLLITLLNERNVSLSAFIDDQELMQIWTMEIASNFLEPTFGHLDPVQLKLLLAFSVYRKPIPIEAAQAVINSGIPRVDLLIALPKLIKQHLLRTTYAKDNYQLHPIVADYARSNFTNNSLKASMTDLQTAHLKASNYYQDTLKNRFSSGTQQRNKDGELLVEAVWHLLQAKQVEDAYALVKQTNLLNYLFDIKH